MVGFLVYFEQEDSLINGTQSGEKIEKPKMIPKFLINRKDRAGIYQMKKTKDQDWEKIEGHVEFGMTLRF